MIRTAMTWSFSSSSSSLPFFNAVIKPSLKRNAHHFSSLQVKAQSFRDEGRMHGGIVDENLSVLKERIEEVKMKERLERCCCRGEEENGGWNYAASGYEYKARKHSQIFGGGVEEFLQLLGIVGGTIGFTCLGGTLFLCLLSVFLHLNQ